MMNQNSKANQPHNQNPNQPQDQPQDQPQAQPKNLPESYHAEFEQAMKAFGRGLFVYFTWKIGGLLDT